jgi:uracil-DNA glycosylase
MAVATLDGETDFDGWRKAAREFRLAGVEPAAARFVVAGAVEQGGLFDQPIAEETSPTPDDRRAFNVPKEFVDLAREPDPASIRWTVSISCTGCSGG